MRQLIAAGTVQQHLDKVRVGIRQVVGKNHHRLPDHRVHVLDPLQRGTRSENVVGKDVVQRPGYGIALVIAPVLAGTGETSGQGDDGTVGGGVDLRNNRRTHRRQCGGILIGKEGGDGSD